MTLVKRLIKGSAITAAEHDGNMDHVLAMVNMTEAVDAKVLTAAERAKVAAASTLTGAENLSNKIVFGNVEAGAAFTTGALDLSGVSAAWDVIPRTINGTPITQVTPPDWSGLWVTGDEFGFILRVIKGSSDIVFTDVAGHANVTRTDGTINPVVPAGEDRDLFFSSPDGTNWTVQGMEDIKAGQVSGVGVDVNGEIRIDISGGNADYNISPDLLGGLKILNVTDAFTDVGTCTLGLEINTTPVTGISISVTTTPSGDDAATAANIMVDGDALRAAVTNVSGSPQVLVLTLHARRPLVDY